MRTSNYFLLIDSNQVSRYFNKHVLLNTGFTDEVLAFGSCLDAWNFLNNLENTPDTIFLDLHTPAMNGWEFLDHYNKLTQENKSEIIILNNNKLHREEEKIIGKYNFPIRTLDKNLNMYTPQELCNIIFPQKQAI